MNYIGSKFSLLGEIDRALTDRGVPASGIAFDVFTGTGSVAQYLKQRGHTVYANDWQRYAYVTTRAYLSLNRPPAFTRLLAEPHWRGRISGAPESGDTRVYSIVHRNGSTRTGAFARVLAFLQSLPGADGSFVETYCEGGPGGRLYFSRDNGRRIQAIRDVIESWSREGLLTPAEEHWLTACLLESADRVANTASVYGAFLKRIKKTAAKPLTLYALTPPAGKVGPQRHRVFQGDSVEVLAENSAPDHTLTYIDPPYNHRQYASNYHVLETIARWDLDTFEPRGRTGLRPASEMRSDYCVRTRAYAAFDALLAKVRSRWVLFSYNNEGVLPEDQLRALFDRHFAETDFGLVDYQRYRADNDGPGRRYKADRTTEFLVLAESRESVPATTRRTAVA